MKDIYYELIIAALFILFIVASIIDIVIIMNNSIDSLDCTHSEYCYVR